MSEGTPAGQFPITITADHTWGRHRPGTTSSEVVSTVVNAPPDGRRYLSTVEPVTGTAAADLSAGGSLITIAGRVYQRGLGATAPSELVYYLGGRCTGLVTDAGVDDEAPGSATFTVYADETVAATAEADSGDQPVTLTADLTGVDWLRLATTGAAHTDRPGPARGPDPALVRVRHRGLHHRQPRRRRRRGTVHRVPHRRRPRPGGHHPARRQLVRRTAGHPVRPDRRHAAQGRRAGRRRCRHLGRNRRADRHGLAWCQGSRWAWTDAGKSSTVSVTFEELDCPAGVTTDQTQIHAVWVFLNGGQVYIDDIRAEWWLPSRCRSAHECPFRSCSPTRP